MEKMTEQEWMIRCEVFSSARDWEWPQKYDTIPRPWEKGSEILKIMTCPMYRLSVDASVLLGGRKFLWRERKEKISFKRNHYLLHDRKAPKEFLGVEEVLWQSLFEKNDNFGQPCSHGLFGARFFGDGFAFRMRAEKMPSSFERYMAIDDGGNKRDCREKRSRFSPFARNSQALRMQESRRDCL